MVIHIKDFSIDNLSEQNNSKNLSFDKPQKFGKFILSFALA
jgi:hypothetical protein